MEGGWVGKTAKDTPLCTSQQTQFTQQGWWPTATCSGFTYAFCIYAGTVSLPSMVGVRTAYGYFLYNHNAVMHTGVRTNPVRPYISHMHAWGTCTIYISHKAGHSHTSTMVACHGTYSMPPRPRETCRPNQTDPNTSLSTPTCILPKTYPSTL